MKRKALERDILADCLVWLRLAGYLHWRMPIGPVMRGGGSQAKRFSKSPISGFPDICGILKIRAGILFAVELKTEDGILKNHQKIWIERIQKAGGIAFVARSLEEMVQKLKEAEGANRTG